MVNVSLARLIVTCSSYIAVECWQQWVQMPVKYQIIDERPSSASELHVEVLHFAFQQYETVWNISENLSFWTTSGTIVPFLRLWCRLKTHHIPTFLNIKWSFLLIYKKLHLSWTIQTLRGQKPNYYMSAGTLVMWGWRKTLKFFADVFITP